MTTLSLVVAVVASGPDASADGHPGRWRGYTSLRRNELSALWLIAQGRAVTARTICELMGNGTPSRVQAALAALQNKPNGGRGRPNQHRDGPHREGFVASMLVTNDQPHLEFRPTTTGLEALNESRHKRGLVWGVDATAEDIDETRKRIRDLARDESPLLSPEATSALFALYRGHRTSAEVAQCLDLERDSVSRILKLLSGRDLVRRFTLPGTGPGTGKRTMIAHELSSDGLAALARNLLLEGFLPAVRPLVDALPKSPSVIPSPGRSDTSTARAPWWDAATPQRQSVLWALDGSALSVRLLAERIGTNLQSARETCRSLHLEGLLTTDVSKRPRRYRATEKGRRTLNRWRQLGGVVPRVAAGERELAALGGALIGVTTYPRLKRIPVVTPELTSILLGVFRNHRTGGEIRAYTGLNSPTIARGLRRLREAGLIAARTAPHGTPDHPRARAIFRVTERGRAVLGYWLYWRGYLPVVAAKAPLTQG